MAGVEPQKIVVVGSSIAGVRAAEEFRRRGYDGELVMIGKEQHFPPYDRPPLSKEVLSGKWDPEQARLFLYEEVRAELILGTAASGLDVARQEVRLGNGSTVPYDRLVIATGAAARPLRVPGAELDGVHYLRTAEDCVRVLQGISSGPRVTIIGAGFIGAEVASVCREQNLQVTLVDVSTRPLSEAVGDRMSEYFVKQHLEHGTTMRLGVGISKVIGADRVERVELTDGSYIDTDLLIVGIGVVPETAWLDTSELVLDNGVVCDEFCAPLGTRNMAAAGDVARWFNPRYGVHTRVEHWSNAVEQAEYVAGLLLEGRENRPPFAGLPYFWSDQYGSRVQFVGVSGPQAEVSEGSLEEGKCVITYTRMGRPVGALCINWPARLQKYRKLLERSSDEGQR
ncbi:NAD(P)/FAD-dependent oxidoreductase [Streptomyces sp. Y7]|uniref:NAD(P)/FAD-dependent oxidoreductase n=1 Tax=Streptomyces sp. Y7 TaxID=3342392 RepID=UPI00371453ED